MWIETYVVLSDATVLPVSSLSVEVALVLMKTDQYWKKKKKKKTYLVELPAVSPVSSISVEVALVLMKTDQ